MSLIQEVEQICERVCKQVLEERAESLPATPEQNAEALDLRRRLAQINAKENLSKKEAALLLGCSEGHLRNLVAKSRKKQTRHPIPFNDLDGPVSFNREALLTWAGKPKEKCPKGQLLIAK